LTYQLRRLRLHGIIERAANSFRYRITAFGFRAALFFTRAPASPPPFRIVMRPMVRSNAPSIKSKPALLAWLPQQKLVA
jgi:hypothetical protein